MLTLLPFVFGKVLPATRNGLTQTGSSGGNTFPESILNHRGRANLVNMKPQANFNLVLLPTASDSLVTQVDIWGVGCAKRRAQS